jgi:uncharacterized protein (TIGR03435 family)
MRLAALLLLSFSALAQPAFEVASVKPSTPDVSAHLTGGPGTADPGRWTCTNCSLFALLTQAYAVFEYQLQIPDWTKSATFDIVAKLPPGPATRDEFRLMLEHLLEERFQMKTHRESREQAVYELTVAKGGSKLQQVSTPIPAPPPNQPAIDRDGYPNVPGGTGIRIAMGRARLQFRGQIMKNLAHFLSPYAGQPVVDATGLAGTYAMTLSWVATPRPDDVGPTLFQAVEDQLGLKLKPTRAAIETIVVDRLEKTPSGN